MCWGGTVLNMRGSLHLKQIREFNIDEKGIHIGKPIHHASGILAGKPVPVSPGEIERLRQRNSWDKYWKRWTISQLRSC